MKEIDQDFKFSYSTFIDNEPLFYLMVFYMVIFQGHTYKYVANIFNISCEAVRLIVKKMSIKIHTLVTGKEFKDDNSNKKQRK